MFDFSQLNLTLEALQQHYQQKDFTPDQLVEYLLARNAEVNASNPMWIRLLTQAELQPWLDRLAMHSPDQLPLYGVPFAIKDNVDLAGIPTTAACPDFSYVPEQSAQVVAQLLQAGALPLGKTNLDQFATGLVGMRSPEPWGPCHNALNPDYISGGSSSGSGVSVSMGLVSFSLGTDTAGSGRVPAALNNIVGVKPSRGMLSSQGMVPACRTLDCLSIFALSARDANQVLDCCTQFDPQDDYGRANPFANGPRYFSEQLIRNSKRPLRLGIPKASQLAFFGNQEAEQLFNEALANIGQMNVEISEIDFEPFLSAAKLLYEGPWVAERYLAVQSLLESSPESLLPVIRTIIEPARDMSACDSFSAQYKMQHFQQQATALLDQVDAMLTPTIGTIFTREDVAAEPIARNSELGYYTNFMNLLDLAAIAIPTGFYRNKVGFGITLFHQKFTDKRLLSLAADIQQQLQLPLGATSWPLTATPTAATTKPPQSHVDLVVCGAHLEGLALNWQLIERGAELVAATESSAHYRLYALAGGPPLRPGMVRVSSEGSSIPVEVWRLPIAEFGSFVAEIPAPLGIGKVELASGEWLPGFVCDQYGLEGAEDITEMGGWRPYLAQLKQ